MQNSEIARILYEIADLLEIQGGDNPFRIRSYQKSAQTVEGYSGSIERLALDDDPKRLLEIPGIGQSIAATIREICRTGDCHLRVKLATETPRSLLELLQIPNLGPKKVNLLYQSLKIQTIDELEQAARSGKLRGLPGMGERTEQKVLAAIEKYRLSHGRRRLSEAMQICDDIVGLLRGAVDLDRVEVAGSVRRRRDTVGDIDILVACQDAGAALSTFTRFSAVEEVIGQGDTKASVRLRGGVQADLRVLPEENFGAALQYFTGSKAHNVVLRERAKRMGYKVSEYGVFTKDDKWVAGRTEEDIYTLLNLDFIPPELRENLGEIEASERHQLPLLVERRHIRGDLHCHTNATDGRHSIEEMAAAAERLGYEYLAITDHSKAIAMARGLDEQRLLEHMQEIEEVQKKFKSIRILKGIEADILADGTLDLEDSVLERLDIVVASVHSRMNLERGEMTARVCRALRNRCVNVLGHPTGRILGRREPFPIDIEEVLSVARQEGVFLELNSHPDRLDLNDIHCRMARDAGVPVVVSTDSHSTGHFDLIDYGIFTARRGWLEPQHIVNTVGLDELARRLAERRKKGGRR